MEMCVVIVLIVMFATLLMPSLFKSRDSQNSASFRTGLTNIALAAREYAVRNQTTTAIQFDENGNIGWGPTVEETDSQGNTLSQEQTDRNTNRRTLTKPADVTFIDFQFYNENVSEADWKCEFYSNGTADDSKLEFEQNGRPFVYSVEPKLGSANLRDGRIADQTPNEWDAGELEQRA